MCNDSRRAFLGLLLKAPLSPAAVLAARQVSATVPPATQQVLMDDFPIAGFSYYDATAVLPTLSPGVRLALRPEPAPPHPAFAVEIHHGPAKLGYVPRFRNRHVSRLLRDGVPLTCEVEGLAPDSPPWDAVAVGISLPASAPPVP